LRKGGTLIAFLGPVGVGKSTVMQYLALLFKAKGRRVYLGTLKSFHSPAYMLWSLVAKLLRLRSKGKYAPWLILFKSGKVNTVKSLFTLSMYSDALFSIPIKLIGLRLLRRLSFVVLVEEHAYTAIIDYWYVAKQMLGMNSIPRIPQVIILSLLNKYKPDVVIILVSDFKELMKRWRERGYGEPQQRYLKLLVLYCLNLIKNPRKLIIDTTNLDTYETVKHIYRAILSLTNNSVDTLQGEHIL